MGWDYNFIDHTADIAVEAEGDTLEDLFTASASAWRKSVIEKAEIISHGRKEIPLQGFSYEELLVGFLNELNFLLLTKKWIFEKIEKIEITEGGNKFRLKAEIIGDNVEENKYQMKAEIKAVTFHQMEIKKLNNRYTTRIVFDI